MTFCFCYYLLLFVYFFFLNIAATTEIYTLSLHDALPIWSLVRNVCSHRDLFRSRTIGVEGNRVELADRKSTRLNSSHGYISYAVFCLKKKKDNYNLLRFHVMLYG